MNRLACAALMMSIVTAGQLSAQSARKQVRDGNRLYQEKKYDQALTKYQDALLTDPDNPRIRFNVGDALYRSRKYEKALEAFRKAAGAGDPALDSQTWFNMGNALYRMGKLEDSIQAYKQALKLDSNDMDAKHNLELARRLLKRNAQPQSGKNQDQNKQSDQQDSPGSKPDNQPRGSEEQKEEQQSEPQPGEDKPAGSEEQQRKSQSDSGSESGEKDAPAGKAGQAEPMSEEEATRLLDALKNDEKFIQKMRKMKATKRVRIKKDWTPE